MSLKLLDQAHLSVFSFGDFIFALGNVLLQGGVLVLDDFNELVLLRELLLDVVDVLLEFLVFDFELLDVGH